MSTAVAVRRTGPTPPAVLPTLVRAESLRMLRNPVPWLGLALSVIDNTPVEGLHDGWGVFRL